MTDAGRLHHVELWVADLAATKASLGWLLGELGWVPFQSWDAGCSWRLDATYLVVEQSPAMVACRYDRLRPGLNHLAFHVASASEVDRFVAEAPSHGWTLLFADRHPHAGGPDTYAAYLEDTEGLEVELVAP
ncbi:VOC family protein [Tenggerimyces flavus]|uniref:VOC family protein n=1 Tax=Tenggerimyces flavus TaxID=1708749 RepID=A0ABV7YKV3_9ACTN|nr:VOC family protein [Tenggerimyces flavus]MBM7784843.1 catechol 2,3-dioxygenase-like lactoylglutathione lyase family enzyme [Tenggerimyces flavus]